MATKDSEVLPARVDVATTKNPFAGTRVESTVPVGLTLREIVAAQGLRETDAYGVQVWLNGEIVPDRMLDRVKPKEGTRVFVRVVPHGGEAGKAVLTIVVGVLAVAAGFITGGASIAAFFSGAGFVAGTTSAGAALAGAAGMLAGLTGIATGIQSLVAPPPQVYVGAIPETQDSAALTGTRNTARLYKPIRTLLGRYRVYPDLLGKPFVEQVGKDSILRLLMCFGYGPMDIEDIKIGGFDPQGVVKEQAKLRGGKATRATETLLDATRAPEITARTATLFALLREGHSLDDAIDIAKLAHVDYSDLTKFERERMKRALPYYTFSRKYMPFALERMSKDPSLIVGWQKTFENSDTFGIDENGTPVLSMGKFEADIGRLNANVDAMMALAGTVELMSGTVGSEIQKVQRPGFASFSGGALSPLLAATGAGSEEGASVPAGLQEMWDAVFVTRFVDGAAALARGEGGQKLGDSALSWILPARFNAEPDKARQFQLNVARRVMRRLELQAQEATTEAQLASLRRQAAEIRQAIQTVQQDFGSR